MTKKQANNSNQLLDAAIKPLFQAKKRFLCCTLENDNVNVRHTVNLERWPLLFAELGETIVRHEKPSRAELAASLGGYIGRLLTYTFLRATATEAADLKNKLDQYSKALDSELADVMIDRLKDVLKKATN